MRRPTSSHLLLILTWSMSLRWSPCPQPTLGHLDNMSSCPLDDLQLPAQLLTCHHPNLQDCYKYHYMYYWQSRRTLSRCMALLKEPGFVSTSLRAQNKHRESI